MRGGERLPLSSWLLRRRQVWFPTALGWLCLFLVFAVPIVFWWFRGERFLAATHKVPAEILVVEGWIGGPAVTAAALEFQSGGYRLVITTGGVAQDGWSPRRWQYSEVARNVLVRAGVPEEQILLAPAPDVETQRTYESALAVRRVLEMNAIAGSVTVFTRGAHARRSRLVFNKVLGRSDVGVIGWQAPKHQTSRWWQSSDRARDFLSETIHYPYEFLLNSGRSISRPAPDGFSKAAAPPSCVTSQRTAYDLFDRDSMITLPLLKHEWRSQALFETVKSAIRVLVLPQNSAIGAIIAAQTHRDNTSTQ